MAFSKRKVFFGFSLVLLALPLAFLASVLTTTSNYDLADMPHYQEMQSKLRQLAASPGIYGDTLLRAGWAKAALVPDFDLPMAGYGSRKGAHAVGVRDSVWVRAVVFESGGLKSAMVAAEMLIVPPEVTARLQELLAGTGIPAERCFLSATHTHSSLGGWSPGLVGRLFAGKYEPQAVDFVAKQIALAVQLAAQNLQPVKTGFARAEAPDYAYNRLVGDEGTVYPYLRTLVLETQAGEKALISTYSGHATCLPDMLLEYSGDYPGHFVRALEARPGIVFAMFAAGAVGSTSSYAPGAKTGEEAAAMIGDSLAAKVMASVAMAGTTHEGQVAAGRITLPLPAPQPRVSLSFSLRPYVFRQVFGDYPSFVSYLNVGGTLFVGTPCDFSGELMVAMEQNGVLSGKNVVLTSFNGGYIGYVTDDRWYGRDTYETLTMNWFGPHNGRYFMEIVGELADVFQRPPTP